MRRPGRNALIASFRTLFLRLRSIKVLLGVLCFGTLESDTRRETVGIGYAIVREAASIMDGRVALVIGDLKSTLFRWIRNLLPVI